MKRVAKLLLLTITFALIFVVNGQGAAVVGERTVTGGTLFDPTKSTIQSTTGLVDTETLVFPDVKLKTGIFVLWIENTGANPLTDLKIMLTPNEDNTGGFDMQGKSSLGGTSPNVCVHQVGCVDTLAAGALCVVSSNGSLPFPHIYIKATAGAAAATNLKIILNER